MNFLFLLPFLFFSLPLKGSSIQLEETKVHILLIEHASSKFPTEVKCLLGDLDVPLSQKGRLEAEALRQKFANSQFIFHRVLTSDLKRASETTEILVSGSNLPIEQLSALRETNKGNLQDLIRTEYRKMDSYKEYKAISNLKDRFFVPMGYGDHVESKGDLAKRLIPLINILRNDPDLRGKTVLIVTHGNPIKVFHTLSINPTSLNSSKKLRDELKEIPNYADPKSCSVIHYIADPHSFDCLGELQFNEDGTTEIIPYPELK